MGEAAGALGKAAGAPNARGLRLAAVRDRLRRLRRLRPRRVSRTTVVMVALVVLGIGLILVGGLSLQNRPSGSGWRGAAGTCTLGP